MRVCYSCSGCNACGKVDRINSLKNTCPVCGKSRSLDDEVCPHCGAGKRPKIPDRVGVPAKA